MWTIKVEITLVANSCVNLLKTETSSFVLYKKLILENHIVNDVVYKSIQNIAIFSH